MVIMGALAHLVNMPLEIFMQFVERASRDARPLSRRTAWPWSWGTSRRQTKSPLRT